MTSSGVAAGFFQGEIDEARIWSVARTPAEILATKDLEISSATGLVARWGLNFGSGNIAANSVAPLAGTLTNGPTWVAGLNLVATNVAPVAVADSFSTPVDTQLDVIAPGVLANDSDGNSDPLMAVLVDDVSHGALTLNSDGSFSYTPAGGYFGPDSFTYKANDGTADSNTVTVDLTIDANNVPVANDDSYSTPYNTPLIVAVGLGVLGNDTDLDTDPLTASVVTNVAHGVLVLNANGGFTYTPTFGYEGPDSFTYQANDGTADSNTATVSLTVDSPPTNTALDLGLLGSVRNLRRPGETGPRDLHNRNLVQADRYRYGEHHRHRRDHDCSVADAWGTAS